MYLFLNILNVKSIFLIVFFSTLLSACGGGGGGNSSTPVTTTLVSISITPANQNIQTGNDLQLTALATYSDASIVDITSNATWSSLATDIASVTTNGLVSGLTAGDTNIIASFEGLQANLSITTFDLVTLTSLNISPDNFSKIKVGNTQQFAVTATYSDTSTSDVTNSVNWVSSETSIASLSTDGLLEAITAGETIITVTLDGQTSNLSIEVIDLIDISVSPVTLTLPNGSIQQYIATGLYTDNSTEDLSETVIWSVDNATINSDGLLTATSVGASTVTASIDETIGSASLTTSSAVLQSLSINASPIIAKGITEQLSAIGVFSDGSSKDISNLVSWSSNNTEITTVVENTGFLTAIETGNSLITASTESLSTTVSIDISDATIVEIAITPSALSLAKGSSNAVNIIAIFTDQSFVDISNEVQWQNTNSSTAAITPNTNSTSSTLVANDLGVTTLTASFQTFEATLEVTVTDAILSELTISPTNTSIPVGLSQRFYASGLYSDGSIQDLSTQVTWISDNEATATIDNITTLEGTAHSLSAGIATISATFDEITQTTNLNVTTAQLNTIEIQPSKQTAAIDYNVPIQAFGQYTDGSVFDITNLAEWSASDQSILNLAESKNGIIRTEQVGNTLINASFNNISGLGQVFVTASTLQSIQITTLTTTIPKLLQQQFQAIGTFSDTTTADITQQVTWQSSDTLLANIDNSLNPGLLQTHSAGNVTVSASLNDITSQVPLIISNAVISSINVTAPKNILDITMSTQATASASFSDDSIIDITQWVNWVSAAPSIVSVNNDPSSKGILSGQSVGASSVTASLNNITSSPFAMTVTKNADNPAAINLTITPNAILNNNLDSTMLQAAVLPTDDTGEIADGTLVTFTLVEGDDSREIEATTLDGVAAVEITSTYQGLISVSAEIEAQDINSFAALFSTDNFANVIGMSGQSSAAIEDGSILTGSIFLLFARNISNREFIVNQAIISTSINDTPELIESVNEPASLSDGLLSSGEFSLIGYLLDEDLESENISITYAFEDEPSGLNFFKGITFSL